MKKESQQKTNEAFVIVDVMKPDSRNFTALLRKHNIKMSIKTANGPSGVPEVVLSGKRKDLEKVLSDEKYGLGNPDLADFIEEGVSSKQKTNFKHVMLFEEFTYESYR